MVLFVLFLNGDKISGNIYITHIQAWSWGGYGRNEEGGIVVNICIYYNIMLMRWIGLGG